MKDQEIIKMYSKQKMSTYEIAKHLNTYPNKIRRVLLKNGIHMNDKSTAQKNAIKNGTAKIPTKGRCRSKEEKLKISSSLKKRWSEISEDDYNEHVRKAKERWSNLSESTKRSMNEAAIKAIQKAGKEGSKLEKFLVEELRNYGHEVRPHVKNLIPNENLEIDMYFPNIKLIVEIDGPSHFMPIWGEDKLKKQIKADAHKTGLILSKGFAIIRVKSLADSISLSSREELKDNLINLLDKIKKKFPKQSDRYIEIEI